MPGKIALVVDDEAAIRLYITAVLKQNGFETIEAADGLEAVDLLRNAATRVDLLIADVQMPNMNGIALARAVRTEYPKIRVVLVSGYCSPDEASDLDVEFIPKPFTPATLLSAIGCVMTDKKEPRSETNPQPSITDKKVGG